MTVEVPFAEKRFHQQQKQSALRILLISVLMLLSGYYLWVLYKAITPNVSLAYKAYYIKNQTLYWQPKQPNLALTLPTTLDVTQNLPNLSRAGWSHDIDNNARELNQLGGLYFTIKNQPTTNITLSINVNHSQHTRLPFTFNSHSGDLIPINNGKTLIATLTKHQFLSSNILQSIKLIPTHPLNITSINLRPIAHQSPIVIKSKTQIKTSAQ